METTCGLVELHHVLGKKWTYGLLYNISEKPLSFSQLDTLSRRSINPSLLSKRLKEMVNLGIIKQEGSSYIITQEGKELKQLLAQIKMLSLKMGCNIPEPCKHRDCAGCHLVNKLPHLYHR